MSERYTRLFVLSKDLYIDGSPVVISAGALLKDNDTNSVLVQLKFKNICRMVIKAVTVKIIPMDSAGRVLGESVEHKFLDISAKRNDEFAQKEPVYLSDNSTRAFSVYVSEVIFDDNSIWSCEDAGWETLPNEEIRFGDSELLKQYKMTYGAYAGKQPVYMNSIWKCTCGYINNSDEDKCQNCSIEIGKLKAFDMEQLKEACSARLEKEEQARQEAKKKAEEEQKRKEAEKKRLEAEQAERQRIKAEKRKRITKIEIITGVVAVCIGGVVYTNMTIIPDIKYNKAVSLIESESYDEAFALLEDIGSYKNAEGVYRYAKDYVEACSALESGSYSEAISGFNYLASSDYKDSRKLLEQAIDMQYEKGLSLLESGTYDEAIECFKSLGYYKDSKEQLEKALDGNNLSQYENALSLFETSSYKEAFEIFHSLGNYKDSDEKEKQCAELLAVMAIKEGKYSVGDQIELGKYSWRILEIIDNSVLIITEECIESTAFSKKNYADWENSSIRQYLNSDFYDRFSDIEKSIIMITEVVNDDNPDYGTSDGYKTTDKLFLLSLDEVEKYFSTSNDKIAIQNGFSFNCDWWLRTSGKTDCYACYVSKKGDTSIEGESINKNKGVRPAMWISLE